MDGYIKLSNLAIIVIVAIAAVCGVYLILLLRNLNSSIKVLKDILKDNKKNIDETLKNMPVISKNTAEITDKAKDELKLLGAAVHEFGAAAEFTSAATETVNKDIIGKLRSLVDIIDFIIRLFKRKSKNEKTGQNK